MDIKRINQLPVADALAENTNVLIEADGSTQRIPADKIVQKGVVKTVNNTAPDENGNVNIEVPAPVTIDNTLTQSGQAADSAAVGEKVSRLSEEIAANDLPLIFYGGAIPQVKDIEVTMPFDFCSKSGNMKLFCETKAQGTSSMAYPKKNQTTKFFADAACTEKVKINFRNWGKQNKFCMKANWIDITHARNIVSARIWGDMVRSRANFAELPELLRTSPNVGAIDGFPVLAYVDGEYHGRYTINIPKDGWMANMDDENPNHCILCGENYVSGCFRAPALIDESDWSDELHKVVPENIKTRWNEVIGFVMNSTDDEFKANLGNYFDVPSLIDYNIFAIASCGLDSMGKNQIYLAYDGQKWYASMYDMDSTWGLYWDGTRFIDATYSRKNYEDYVADREGNLLYIRLEKLFHNEIKSRWDVLKAGALSYANIMRRFEEFIGIVPPYVIAEDYAITTGCGAFTAIPSKDTNNIQQIRAFAKARLEYTAGYINALPNVYIPDADVVVTWSKEANQGVDGTTGLVGPGGDYITNIIPVEGNNYVALCNIGDATYTYISCHQYDSNMEYIGTTAVVNSDMTLESGFNPNTAYIRVTAFPSDVETNNNPTEQIKLILGNKKWSNALCNISPTNGLVTSGTDFALFELLSVDGQGTITLANAAGSSYRYLRIAQYAADGSFIELKETPTSPNVTQLVENAAYVRFAVSPGNAATDNDPENQLVITVSN